MTQEQFEIVNEWRDSLNVKQNDEHIVNAMWLAEEMWEAHHAITTVKHYDKELGTYIMAFCIDLMEHIWMPHEIVKEMTENLNDLTCVPESFYCRVNNFTGNNEARIIHMSTNDEGHDNEVHYTWRICDDVTEAKAITAILNNANQAGHDAIKRLSA